MSGDLKLARRDRRSAAPAGQLGLPTNCQLGTLGYTKSECREPAYKTVGKIRICKKHDDILMSIKRDAIAAKHRIPKKPSTQGYRRLIDAA